MLSYNTQLKHLILPEYGRTIQNMVDYCLTLEDRDERTRCAYSIIKAMRIVVPGIEKTPEAEHKLWDHLAVMSDFKLDIDYPFEPVRPDDLAAGPEPIANVRSELRHRHYGKCIIDMINVAANMEPGTDRDELIMLLANHMKKSLLAINRDGTEDEKIFRDLADLSRGAIRLDPATVKLHVFTPAPEPKTGKKRKKK